MILSRINKMFHKPDDTTEQSFHNSILVQTNQPHIETDQQYAERVANMQNFPDTNTTIQNNKSFTYISLKDLARLGDTSIELCIDQAYDVISKRTGKMVNGTFVKDTL